jgi:drug/metabolite transporter (DMT)-like permease
MMLNAILLIFVIITWGYSWVLMKIGLNYMGPFTLAAWRCTIGGLAMVPLLYVKGISLPRRGTWLDYTMVGLFQTTGMFAFMLYGMKFVSAGKTSVLLYTMSIWTSLLAHFYLKERLTALRWLGIASGGVGILCILGWDVLVNQDLEILFGEFLIILGAVSWAIANIIIKKQMPNENAYMVNGLQMPIGTLGLALLALPVEGLWHIKWTWVSISVILFTGIIASTINFTIWFYLLKKLDTHTATSATMLVPVFGLLFDWLQLGKTLDTGIIVGGVLVLAGIYQVSKRQKSDKLGKEHGRRKEAAL